MVPVSMAAAVVAAVFFAVSAVCQQRAAHGVVRLVVPGRRSAGRRTAQRLVGSRLWLTGSALAGLGFAFHATALQLGSVAFVQPVMTLTLPVSVLLGAARAKLRIASWDWLSLGVMCAAVVAFLTVTAAPTGAARGRGLLFTGTVVAIAIVVALVVIGRLLGSAGRAALWGAAAAGSFGITATLTKATTGDLATHGLGATLTSWPLYLLIIAAVGGVALEQAAFAIGPLTAVMVPVTLLNPLGATLIASFGWHQRLLGGAVFATTMILIAVVLATVGIIMLARSSLVQPAPARVR